MGCDLYTFSGGKGLCGPQSSGILLGRKDLIEAALANSNPWEGAVCRPPHAHDFLGPESLAILDRRLRLRLCTGPRHGKISLGHAVREAADLG
jgi:hypothetical protein